MDPSPFVCRWANHTILQEQLTNEKAMVEIQHRSNSTLSLKTLPPGSIDMLADCMQPKPHDKEGKRRFDLSRIEVTSPLYKMLTQPSVLQLGLTAGSSDVSRTLLSYFESPMAVTAPSPHGLLSHGRPRTSSTLLPPPSTGAPTSCPILALTRSGWTSSSRRSTTVTGCKQWPRCGSRGMSSSSCSPSGL